MISKEKLTEMVTKVVTISDLESQLDRLIENGVIRLDEFDESDWLDIYPIALALLNREARRIAFGAANKNINADIRRKAKKIENSI